LIEPIVYGYADCSDITSPVATPTPVDSATGVLISASLVVEITDDDSGVDTATVIIVVDGITVWTGGGAVNGWSGIQSAIAGGYSYTLTPPNNFEYSSIHAWSADADDEAGNSVSGSWTFTVEASPVIVPPVFGHSFTISSIQVVGSIGSNRGSAGAYLQPGVDPVSGIGIVHRWNQYDDHAALVSLSRKKGEKNWELARRTRDTMVNLANSSYRGLVNGITRNLGLSLFKAIHITPKMGHDGTYLAADPYILFKGPYLYLYIDYSNNELEYQIDRYEPGGNYDYLHSLVDFINTSTYFTAGMRLGTDEYTRSMTILNQSNRGVVNRESIQKSTRFRLEHRRLVPGTVFFSDRDLFYNEVQYVDLVDARGKYHIDYSKGIITVYTVSSQNITVRYQYTIEPFYTQASPVILHDINGAFREKLFQQVLQDDGTYVDGVPTELGVEIINEIFSVTPMYWGV
jgi:hypothetical protein